MGDDLADMIRWVLRWGPWLYGILYGTMVTSAVLSARQGAALATWLPSLMSSMTVITMSFVVYLTVRPRLRARLREWGNGTT